MTVNIFLRFLYPNLIEIAVMFLTAGLDKPFYTTQFFKIFLKRSTASVAQKAL